MRFLIITITTVLTFTLFASSLSAQISIGGRYSNYATDIDLGPTTIETGRQSSVGFLIGYRSGGLVLDGRFDHDFETGIRGFDFLPINIGEYSRNRAEFTLGYAVVPGLVIEGGLRVEDVSVGGRLFGQPIFSAVDVNHQALVVGLRGGSSLNTQVGWYAGARGYFGSADVKLSGLELNGDTTGLLVEAGLPIAIGTTGWYVAPGFEYETIDIDNTGVGFDTNRFVLSFVFRGR